MKQLDKLVERIQSARKTSTPIVSWTTPDPAASIRLAMAAFEDKRVGAFPAFQWNIVDGLTGINKLGEDVLKRMCNGEDPSIMTVNLVETLKLCTSLRGKPADWVLPEKSVVFIQNAHRFIDDPGVAQAVWNCRDKFKVNMRMLVLLSPGMTLPSDLQGDVISFEEPLPDPDALGYIVDEAYSYVGQQADPKTKEKAIAALLGLSAFSAEQVATMSLRPTGMDLDDLTERKRKAVEQTPGLRIYRGKETFKDVRGLQNIKGYMSGLIKGKSPANTVVFIDEIDKAIGGSRGDTSGVSADQLGVLLSYMADTEADGILLLGVPGAGKSMVTKAFANEANIPCLTFDLGGMKDSLVGSSERNIRIALRVVDAISGSRPIFVATCNQIKVLPPELRSRFSLGTFFFPLPEQDEREALWEYYLAKYELSGTLAERPANEEGWTGREIRDCSRIAWKLGCSPAEASSVIVPVSVSAKETIEKLCQEANGAFISASHPGIYQYMERSAGQAKRPARQVNVN